MVKQKHGDTQAVRFSSEDRKLIEALRKKTGIQAVSELLRLGLRALATKEGVTA